MKRALVASLLLNAVLVGLCVIVSRQPSVRNHSVANTRKVTLGAPRSVAAGFRSTTTASYADYGFAPRDPVSLQASPALIVSQMRQAGYPPWVILAAVGDVLGRQNGIQTMPPEVREAFKRSGRSAPEVIAFERHRDRLIQEALQLVPEARAGFEEEIVGELTGTAKADRERIKYGELSAESIAALKEVERHLLRVPDAEYEARVREVLPPAEADDYLTFNSPLARRIQGRIQALDIDEETYRALYNRLRASGDSAPAKARKGDITAAESAAYYEVLGAQNFMKAAPQLSYGMVDSSVFSGAGGSGVTAFSAEDVLLAVNVTNALRSDITSVQKQAIARETYANLTAKLANDEARREFSETRFGRMLRSFSAERKAVEPKPGG